METCLTKKLVVQIYYQAENYKIRDHLTTIISYASFACLMHISKAYLFIICAFYDFFLFHTSREYCLTMCFARICGHKFVMNTY